MGSTPPITRFWHPIVGVGVGHIDTPNLVSISSVR
jgi:hypothetical protein